MVDINVDFDPQIIKINGEFRPTQAQLLATTVFEQVLGKSQEAYEIVQGRPARP